MTSEPTLSSLIITLSDRASQNIYDDISGVELESLLKTYMDNNALSCSTQRIVIPDDPILLQEAFQDAVSKKTDFIFTTGGTGIGPRDITPDVIQPLLSKVIPGIMELIRVKHGQQFPLATLSRSIAGVAGQSLVFCLPGNPKAVREYMEEILKILLHSYKMLQGKGH